MPSSSSIAQQKSLASFFGQATTSSQTGGRSSESVVAAQKAQPSNHANKRGRRKQRRKPSSAAAAAAAAVAVDKNKRRRSASRALENPWTTKRGRLGDAARDAVEAVKEPFLTNVNAIATVPLSTEITSETTIIEHAADVQPVENSSESLLQTPCRDSLLYNTSSNIALQLGSRSLTGRTHRLARRTFLPKPPSYMDTSSWLQLVNPTMAGCRKVAWDYDRDSQTGAQLGTLLACAFHDGWIRIYEMDIIQACEVRRRQYRATTRVEPCLSFRSLPALDLQWNPYNRDQLAIQTHQSLQVLDLEQVSAWLQQYEGSSHANVTWDGVRQAANRQQVPCQSFACKTKGSTLATVLFLADKQHILTATDDSVHCFHLLRSGKKPVWTLPWQRVTAMKSIAAHDDNGTNKTLVLLGSSTGNFCVVDVLRLQRQAFSVESRPTILCEWSTCRGIDHPVECMGISHLRIQSVADSNSSTVVRMTWITNGGWIMSSVLELQHPTRPMDQSIHYKTQAVSYVNAENEEVQTKRRAWSIPANGRCRSHATDGILIVEHVPVITHVLPRTEQRVLASTETRIVQDNSKSRAVVMWMQQVDSQLATISLSDTPLSIAIHPQHEWIAVASNTHGVYLLHTRGRCR